jgi:hypothetical protein
MQPNTAAVPRQRAVGGAIICAEHAIVRHRIGIFGITVILALLRTSCEHYAKHDDLNASQNFSEIHYHNLCLVPVFAEMPGESSAVQRACM